MGPPNQTIKQSGDIYCVLAVCNDLLEEPASRAHPESLGAHPAVPPPRVPAGWRNNGFGASTFNATAGATANFGHGTWNRRTERNYPAHYVPQHQLIPSQQYNIGLVNPREDPHSDTLSHSASSILNHFPTVVVTERKRFLKIKKVHNRCDLGTQHTSVC